ncbi:MAG: spermidine/putrescine transporter permease [Chloroflexi bacterium]|jgi:multiple sugar transport system permease protein|nr:spermidine/putrescine transporter permease [Chloroflexota bacterium]
MAKVLRREGLGLLFISPWLVGFLAFGLYPMLASLYYSFTRYSGFGAPVVTGLTNYSLIIHDPVFWTSIWNTLYFVGLGVPLSIVLGLAIALPMNAKVRGVALYRTLIYLPTIVPTVVGALVWLWIFNPDYGLLNSILSGLHLPTGSWLASPDQSKPALLMMVLWGTLGNVVVIMLAGLQDVSPTLIEAAQLDGASAFRRFWHVVLPALSPVIFYNIITSLVFFLQFFDQAYIVSSSAGAGGNVDLGAPVQSTMFYSIYLYQQAFQFQHFGRASAMSWLLLLVTALVTVAFFRGSRRFVNYGGI